MMSRDSISRYSVMFSPFTVSHNVKAERRVLQREIGGPSDVDFEQRARDKNEKQRYGTCGRACKTVR